MSDQSFDIFAGNESDPVWRETVFGLSNARERMEQLAAERPGPYFLFSSTTSAIVSRIETFHKQGA